MPIMAIAICVDCLVPDVAQVEVARESKFQVAGVDKRIHLREPKTK
jgi:hypothetical protein